MGRGRRGWSGGSKGGKGAGRLVGRFAEAKIEEGAHEFLEAVEQRAFLRRLREGAHEFLGAVEQRAILRRLREDVEGFVRSAGRGVRGRTIAHVHSGIDVNVRVRLRRFREEAWCPPRVDAEASESEEEEEEGAGGAPNVDGEGGGSSLGDTRSVGGSRRGSVISGEGANATGGFTDAVQLNDLY
ncbi:hypothetical protein T484DRAFT_1899427 [Baffinella frigidus]|nr:hypothetical protein T484DRAFT_1899427 [Cryptophyta sp. CCMP2293]